MVGISCGVVLAVSYDSLLNKQTPEISLLAIIIVAKVLYIDMYNYKYIITMNQL